MLKEYSCPLNANHGKLRLSPHTPGAYRCPVCNSLFDEEFDLKKNTPPSFLTHEIQRKLYQELLDTRECRVPLGGGRSMLIKEFLKDYPQALVIVGYRISTSPFKDFTNVISYYQFNKTNIHLYKEILIDESSFGMHSIHRQNLISQILNHKSPQELFSIK